MIEKLPSSAASTVPREVSPLNKVTSLPASAVPSIVGVESFVKSIVVVITGASGAAVSIFKARADDAADSFPASSVALTVSV